MTETGVFRPKLSMDGNFTTIPNAWIRSTGLSATANFLLIYFLSHEVGYHLQFEQIERETNIGAKAFRSALKELEAAGFLKAERPIQANGLRGAYRYTITEPTTLPQATIAEATIAQATVAEGTVLRRQLKENNLEEDKEKRTASYLAADWYPSEAVWQVMSEHFPAIDLKLETHAFKDYWTNRNKKMIDWSKTWANWIRNAHKFSQAKGKDESAEVLRRIINEEE
jgi:hypothetical protein